MPRPLLPDALYAFEAARLLHHRLVLAFWAIFALRSAPLVLSRGAVERKGGEAPPFASRARCDATVFRPLTWFALFAAEAGLVLPCGALGAHLVAHVGAIVARVTRILLRANTAQQALFRFAIRIRAIAARFALVRRCERVHRACFALILHHDMPDVAIFALL